jgi:hypothetical protein
MRRLAGVGRRLKLWGACLDTHGTDRLSKQARFLNLSRLVQNSQMEQDWAWTLHSYLFQASLLQILLRTRLGTHGVGRRVSVQVRVVWRRTAAESSDPECPRKEVGLQAPRRQTARMNLDPHGCHGHQRIMSAAVGHVLCTCNKVTLILGSMIKRSKMWISKLHRTRGVRVLVAIYRVI